MKLKRPWTEADDTLLKELAAEISPQRISVRMKRSMHAITSRADYLGLRFDHRPVLRKKPGLSTGLEGSRGPPGDLGRS